MSDASDWKSEMDVTYREIQEINDQLPDLVEREHYAWEHVDSLTRAANKALGEKNLAEHEEIRRNIPGAYQLHMTLQNEIRDLKARKQALWEEHNNAKAEWRRLLGR